MKDFDLNSYEMEAARKAAELKRSIADQANRLALANKKRRKEIKAVSFRKRVEKRRRNKKNRT